MGLGILGERLPGAFRRNFMWRNLSNCFETLKHYPVMSPNWTLRQHVNGWLRNRPYLNATDWYRYYWSPWGKFPGTNRELVLFIYKRLETYSGLVMGCTRPSDRLFEDLRIPLVCWFDWGLTLCDDLHQRFGIDITDSFDERCYETLADLIQYLNIQLSPGAPSAGKP